MDSAVSPTCSYSGPDAMRLRVLHHEIGSVSHAQRSMWVAASCLPCTTVAALNRQLLYSKRLKFRCSDGQVQQ